MKKIRLTDQNNNACSLSNVCFMPGCDASSLKWALEDATNAREFKAIAEEETRLPWAVYEDSNRRVVLKRVDRLGNVDYLIGEKEGVDANASTVYSKIRLTDRQNNACSLRNVCYMGCDVSEFKWALQAAQNAEEFLRAAKKATKLPWTIYKDSPTRVVLKYVDRLGNVDYLIGEREGMRESYNSRRFRRRF